MAKIVLSDLAPAEAIHFSLGNAEIDLGGKSGKQSVETDDRELLSNAVAHPWLTVEVDPAEEAGGQFADPHVPAEEDPQSAANQRAHDAFDVEKIRATEEAKHPEAEAPVAIESGLDQTTEVKVGDVAETVAADETHEPAKSAANFTKGNGS